jgi:hypothetical protein
MMHTIGGFLRVLRVVTYQISLTYLERQKCYGPDKKILFKKQLFDLEVKGQGPKKVITVRNTMTKATFVNFFYRSYQVLSSYQDMLLLYPGELYRLLGASSFSFRIGTHIPNKYYLKNKKIISLPNKLFDLEVKGQGPTNVITVHDTLPYGYAPTYHYFDN